MSAELNKEVFTNILEEQLATKQDIYKLKQETTENIYALKAAIKELDANISAKLFEYFWKTIMVLGSLQAFLISLSNIIQQFHP